jgi:hypothetical protein
MAKIESILSIERKTAQGDVYYVTTAIVDGDECTGWSKYPEDYQVGEKVEKFFDDKHNKAKMRKTIDINK